MQQEYEELVTPSDASVRTLAPVEVLLARAISRFAKQPVSARGAVGIVMTVIAGVLLARSYRAGAEARPELLIGCGV